MGTPGQQRFRKALEAAIWQNAVNEEKYYLNKTDVEEIGQSVGISENTAIRLFLTYAGSSWAEHIMPENGPDIPVYAPRLEVPPDWVTARFDLPWMQRKGKIPFGDQLGGEKG